MKLRIIGIMLVAALLISVVIFAGSHSRSKNTVQCNAYQGWEKVADVTAEKIVFFGELHGTNESPDAVAGLICELVQLGKPIRFGVEASHDQGAALNDALKWPIDSQTMAEAAPRMWSVPDGRSSVAVFKLLEKIAYWKSSGANIEIFAFDSTFKGDDAGLTRAKVMSREVDAAAREFEGAIVVLTGGYHIALNSSHSTGRGGSLASEVRERPVLVMDMQHEGGQAFVTASQGGGEVIVGEWSFGRDMYSDGAIGTFVLSADDERKGYYFVGPITSSPPAFPELIDD
ncbi:MAG: hypothetical protein AAGJ68_03370 [Pseudomonadota bacterium]